jgi:uncharacterized protein YndB with AHSA1/START domain
MVYFEYMEESTLHIERVFNAPKERVWQAFTDAEKIKQWWGPANFSAPLAEVDFTVGGRYFYCMRGAPAPGMPVQDFYSTGVFKEIVPMQKIVATDNFADKDGNVVDPASVGMPGTWSDTMLVTFLFEELPEGNTKVMITHTGHPIEMKENATMGWNQSLDKLAASLI